MSPKHQCVSELVTDMRRQWSDLGLIRFPQIPLITENKMRGLGLISYWNCKEALSNKLSEAMTSPRNTIRAGCILTKILHTSLSLLLLVSWAKGETWFIDELFLSVHSIVIDMMFFWFEISVIGKDNSTDGRGGRLFSLFRCSWHIKHKFLTSIYT